MLEREIPGIVVTMDVGRSDNRRETSGDESEQESKRKHIACVAHRIRSSQLGWCCVLFRSSSFEVTLGGAKTEIYSKLKSGR